MSVSCFLVGWLVGCLDLSITPSCLRRGAGRGPRSQDAGEEGDCTYRYNTVTTRMIFALRWAAVRTILMFH